MASVFPRYGLRIAACEVSYFLNAVNPHKHIPDEALPVLAVSDHMMKLQYVAMAEIGDETVFGVILDKLIRFKL